MTEERVAAIEQAISTQEQRGEHWTNQSIYAQVGGSYRHLARYLMARRAGGGGPVAVSEDDEFDEPPSLHEEYESLVQVHRAARTRLHELDQRAGVTILSEAEELEQLRLRQRVDNMAPVLESLRTQVERHQVEVDIAGVVERWEPLVAQKRDCLQDFVDAVFAVNAAVTALRQAHRAQEGELETLPRRLQERLSFPDVETMVTRLASGLPCPLGWSMLLGQGGLRIAQPHVNAIVGSDPGCSQLSERAVAHFLEER